MAPRDRLILAVLAAGFATLCVEARFEHRDAVTEHWQAWIPTVYSGLAVVASLAGMASRKSTRSLAAFVFLLGIAVGVYGLYMHTGFDLAVFQKFLTPDAKILGSRTGSDGQPMEVFISKPVVAPMGVTGLAAIGFVLTSGILSKKTG